MKTETVKMQMVAGDNLIPAVEQALRDRAHYITTEKGQEKPDFIVEIDERAEFDDPEAQRQWDELAKFNGYTRVYFY